MKPINPVSFISRLFDNKKFLVAFSIVCAVVFWLIIDIIENPSRDVAFTDVSIPITNIEDDEERQLEPIGDYIKTVSVTVNGPGYIVNTVDKADIEVSIASYVKNPNSNTYTLTLSASVAKNDCKVVSISPKEIKVKYDYELTKDIPVEIDSSEFKTYLEGFKDAENGISYGIEDLVGKEFISVTGFSEEVLKIDKAIVKPILTDLELTENNRPVGAYDFKNVEVVFKGADGKSLELDSVDYSTAYGLHIEVYERATVKIVPQFTNVPDYFSSNELKYRLFRNGDAMASKAKYDELNGSIMVKGPVGTIDRLIEEGIKLSPIDFSEITKNKQQISRGFILEEGVEIVDGTAQIIVEVDCGGNLSLSKEILFDPSLIQLINTDGKTYEVVHANAIKIVLCGKSADIKKIKPFNLTLTVDCSEAGDGKTVIIKADKNFCVWSTTTAKVNVIEK